MSVFMPGSGAPRGARAQWRRRRGCDSGTEGEDLTAPANLLQD
jgi:hypothetical protein